MRQRRQKVELELLVARRLQRIRQVHPRPLVAAKAVAGLVELEADLEVRDGVGRHQQLVAVQARQQVLRHVLVPQRVDLLLAVALRLPLGDERLVDEVDDLDEEGAGAGGRVEDLDEVLVGRDALGDLQVLVALRHLAPGGRCRRGRRRGRTRCAAARPPSARCRRPPGAGCRRRRAASSASCVVLLEEELVEVDDRVFLRVPVAEVADDGLHVGVVEQLDDLGDAQLVEVDARPARLAAPPADLEEGLHQLAQEGVRAHVGGEVVGRLLVRVGDARREQAVGDGLRVHVGEAVGVEVVDQRRPGTPS